MTRFSGLSGDKRTIDEQLTARPSNPETGDFYFDTRNNRFAIYNANQWVYGNFTTTTSTSTTTTTTTTTTTVTTSTSTSTTSTTTSTSTTTTL